MSEWTWSRRAGRVGGALLVAAVLAGAGNAEVAAQVPGVASDGDTIVVGPEEAVRLALDASPEVRVARAGLDEAAEQVSEAWGNILPRVDFSAGYTRNVSPQVSFLPARIFDPEAPEGEFLPIQFGADNSWQSTISVEQPIFEAQAFIGVGAAGRYRELQDETFRGTVQATATRVRTTYFDLLLAQEQVRLTRNSLERVRQSLEETRALNRAGLASDYEVLRLEVELSNLEPNLRRARNGVARARRALALDLGIDDPDRLRVEGSLAEMDVESPEENSGANREILALVGTDLMSGTDRSRLLQEAEERRSEVLQAEATQDLRRAELRAEQARYFPRISLTGSYAIQAQQNGSPEFFGNSDTRAYSRLVGIQVSVPIFTGLQRDASVDRRRALLRQATVQTRLARDRTRNEVLDLVDEVEEARERAAAQALAVRQARRGYEIASAEYREGVAGQLQLTDAEVALRESEFNYAEAVHGFLSARARLDQAVGRVPLVDLADR